MGEVTIRFRHDPRTGKRDLVVGFESDEDALQHEHERDHRAMVEALLGHELGEDIGEVRIERVAPGRATSDPEPEAPPIAREPSGGRQG